MEIPVKASRGTSFKKMKQSSKLDISTMQATQEKISRISCESSSSRLFQTDLSKFCPCKLFYIVFVVESDKNSASMLDKFGEISHNYEEVSSTTFISREDVLNLLDTTKNYIFPNQLKPLLLDVIEGAKEYATDKIPSIYEAQLVKLKLIQVMYQQYVARVKQKQKKNNLEDLLHLLSKECKRKQKKDDTGKDTIFPDKNKSPGMEDVKKKHKKDDKAGKDEAQDEDFDYTSVPLDDDGISFEENIFNFIWFYCIKGFYNNEVFQNFTEQLNSPLCAIVKVNENKANNLDTSDYIQSFWKNIDLQFFRNTTPYSFLEDTILMKFIPSKKCNEENVLDVFQQFIFVLRRIVDVKLSHLKYLRYLTTNKIQNIYAVVPLECMQTYHRSLKYFPLECINSTLILDALLKEVCYHSDFKPVTNTSSSKSSGSLMLSRGSAKSFYSLHCTDPLHDFKASKNVKRKISNIKKEFNSFLAHDKNTLLTILKSYKHVGPRIFDISINLMKLIPIFQSVALQVGNDTDDIPHTHDIEPSSKFEIHDKELVDNFMYLFLFKCFSQRVNVPENLKEYSLIANLITFDILDFWNDLKLKCSSENVLENDVNLYEPALVHFRWKEKLTSDVMIQEIFNACNNFSYLDQKYSPETDNFLVIFSDKLDKFGLNTKIYEVVVRTPVCLRDFCRYTTVAEAKWLEKHQTKIIDENTFKVELDEVCPGVQKVKTHMKFFQEYSYLLDANIKEEFEDNKITDTQLEENNFLEENQSVDINFNEVYTDLQRYPTHKNLIQECENAPESQQLLSYNLSTNLFKVTGHITTFYSHDGVKVIVDNTRFLQNPEKCTINVVSEGNTLTLHSSKALKMEPYIIGLLLKDGTRISFIIKNQQYNKVLNKPNTGLEEICEENEEEINNIVYEVPREKSNERELIEPSVNQMAHCVDEDFFKDLLRGDETLENLALNNDSDDLMEAILNAQQNNGIIYKINPKSEYLKRLNPDLKVPVDHALRNILPRNNIAFSSPKSYETHTKRFEAPNEDKSDLEVKNSVDFRLCFPNGLFIRAHPCVIDKNKLMIKQEYAEEKPNCVTVQHEEFRLFSCLGFIFIKKIDGTATILKPNGDIIDFEKPNDDSEEDHSFKPCRCSTLEDYRNKLNKIMKDENNSDYFTSRRGHITHKQNHILDKKLLLLLENFNVPYFKKSITRFDGKKIKIQGDKITQKQMYHMTTQQDFFTEEIFCERNDDFRSTFERNGSQKIMFPDGTLISTSVKIADELVDDFVYVTLSFQYEHKNYATVIFDFDDTLKIMLNNDVIVQKRIDADSFTVNMQKNVLVSVSKEQVLFQKTCEDCLGSFQCHFYIEPFYWNRWNPLEEFLNVEDTYDKHFYSDFVGNCTRKYNYIKGRMNALNCNHRMKNNYAKLFVINKDFSGERLCPNNMVKEKMKQTKSTLDGSVVCSNLLSNKDIKTVDCRQKKCISYCDRFFNNSVLNYFYHSTEQKEVYSTFRVFYSMFMSVTEIEPHILKLQEMYFSDFFPVYGEEVIFKNIASLKFDLEIYKNLHEKAMQDEQEHLKIMRKEREEQERKKKSSHCPCIKKRLGMVDKINNWRNTMAEFKKKIKNRRIPDYFDSEFCKISK